MRVLRFGHFLFWACSIKEKDTLLIKNPFTPFSDQGILNDIYRTASKGPQRGFNTQLAQRLWALDSSLELPCTSWFFFFFFFFTFPITAQIHGVPLNFVKIEPDFQELSWILPFWNLPALKLEPYRVATNVGSKFWRAEEPRNKGVRILSDRQNCMTLQEFLQDFFDVFHQNFLPKRCFHGWTRSFDWGISSLLNILGKSAWKISRKSRLTLSSLTTVTIGFLAAAYSQVFWRERY